MVPTLGVGLLGGTVADAADRRKLVLVTSGGLAAVSAGLAAQAFAGLRLVWVLYALVAVQYAFRAVDTPARSTFLSRLLPPGQVPAGLALNLLVFPITLTAGPAVAGLIAATPHLGLSACYLIDALSFAAALYGVARLPAMRPQGRPLRPGLRAVAEGIGFIRRSQVLAGAFLADLNATVFGMPVALFPAINAERFGGNPRTLGLLTAAIGAGGLVSGLLSGPAGHIRRQGRAMLATVAMWGAAFAGFAVCRDLWLTLAFLAAAGAADTFTVVFRGAIAQTVGPGRLRGRVLAADFVVSAGGAQLGNLEAGGLASLTTPVVSALAGGLVTIAGALMIGFALPGFTRYRRPAADEPADGHVDEPADGHVAGAAGGHVADDHSASGPAAPTAWTRVPEPGHCGGSGPDGQAG